ncbi:transposase [Myxococcus xanthus]|uniref:transposase n=1 Tax=Myxococcus xanthus TaxID=34 RepID=UPI003AB8B351
MTFPRGGARYGQRKRGAPGSPLTLAALSILICRLVRAHISANSGPQTAAPVPIQIRSLRHECVKATFGSASRRVSETRTVPNVSALVAYGEDEDRHRHLLDIHWGSESVEFLSGTAAPAAQAGLTGIRLVIADERAGLAAVARRMLIRSSVAALHGAPHRNALAKAPWRLRGRLGTETSAALRTPSLQEAPKHQEAFQTGLGRQVSRPWSVCVRASPPSLTSLPSPAPLEAPSQIHGLEQLHGEVKRRIRAVGAVLDRASALRLITAIVIEVTSVWNDRRYRDMSLMSSAPDTTAAGYLRGAFRPGPLRTNYTGFGIAPASIRVTQRRRRAPQQRHVLSDSQTRDALPSCWLESGGVRRRHWSTVHVVSCPHSQVHGRRSLSPPRLRVAVRAQEPATPHPVSWVLAGSLTYSPKGLSSSASFFSYPATSINGWRDLTCE